jgi:hypothetical protein
MKDNVHNYFNAAPDKGSLKGPVLGPLNGSALAAVHGSEKQIHATTDSYWLSSVGSAGEVRILPKNS